MDKPLEDHKIINTKWYHIDKDAIPAKLTYFGTSLKDGCTHPYIDLFLTDVGLTPTHARLVSEISLVGSFLSSIFWGMMTDYTKRKILILLLVSIGTATTMILQPWIPMMLNIANETCSKNLTISLNKTLRGAYRTKESDLRLFWVILASCTVTLFFDGYLLPHTDTSVMTQISQSSHKMDIGRNRVPGSAGFSLASFLVGALSGVKGATLIISKYFIQHFLYAGAVFVFFITSHFLLKKIDVKNVENSKESTRFSSIFSSLCTTLSSFYSIFFFLTLLCIFYCSFDVAGFAAVLMDELNFSGHMIGLVVATSKVAGVLAYIFATKFIKLFRGTFQTFLVCCLCNIAQFACYSYAKSRSLL